MIRPRLAAAYLRRRFAEGARLLEVAAEVGCDRHTVVRHCRVHGIDLPAPQYGPLRRVPSTPDLLTRLGAGESATTIARIHQRVLEDLRSRRGLVERRERHCLTCSRPFESLGPWNWVCERCRSGTPAMEFGS